MFSKINKWIDKERTFDERQMLQFGIWSLVMICVLFIIYSYNEFYIGFYPSLLLFIFLCYLLRRNGKIGLKQQREIEKKKEEK